MKKAVPFFSLLLYTFAISPALGQEAIEWDGTYQIQLADFQSPATKIGETSIYSLHSATAFDFAFQMHSGAFMFTKNFNSKVHCSFKPAASMLTAPDSALAETLVRFARFEFDLAELYARKFRKQLYESKDALSGTDFFQPIYNSVQKEYTARHGEASSLTDLGMKTEKLQELHAAVLKEIESLSDFCKTCKPRKRR